MCSIFLPLSRHNTLRPFSVSSLAAQPPEIPDPTTIASYSCVCIWSSLSTQGEGRRISDRLDQQVRFEYALLCMQSSSWHALLLNASNLAVSFTGFSHWRLRCRSQFRLPRIRGLLSPATMDRIAQLQGFVGASTPCSLPKPPSPLPWLMRWFRCRR